MLSYHSGTSISMQCLFSSPRVVYRAFVVYRMSSIFPTYSRYVRIDYQYNMYSTTLLATANFVCPGVTLRDYSLVTFVTNVTKLSCIRRAKKSSHPLRDLFARMFRPYTSLSTQSLHI